MSRPASSQANRAPQIFAAPDGSPLPIFVESNGIADNRPRLVRTLRNHGANICVDVSLARIILVEPSSSEGRQFVRDWGLDPGKVILEVAWVRRCLEAGRALLENDMWGGCGNLDGTPLDSDADREEAGLFTESKAHGLSDRPVRAEPHTPIASGGRTSSVLPTPRTTPSDSSSSDALANSYNNNIPSSSSQILEPPPPHPPPSSSSQPQHIQPTFPANMIPPFGQLVPQGQFPMSAANPQMLGTLIMSNPEMAAAFMNAMMQGMANNGSMVPHGWSHGPLPPTFVQPPPPGFSMMPPPHPQAPFPMVPPAMNGHSPVPSPVAHDPAPQEILGYDDTVPTSSGHRLSSPHRSGSPLPTFTTVSNSDSDVSSTGRSILLQRGHKGKKRLRDSPELVSARPAKRSNSPSRNVVKKYEKKRSSLSTDHTEHHRNSVPTIPIGIFTSRSGEPMSFFVQVQLRNRRELISQIKRNGGRMVSDPPDADFIILETRPGKDRDQWLKVVKDLKRFALRSGFIEACINSDGIVEEDDFIIEPAKKGRKSSSTQRKKREDSVETEDRASSPPSQSYDDIDRNKLPGSRSPTPPRGPGKLAPNGKQAFTAEEIAYAKKLAQHIWRRNPEIGHNRLGKMLAERVPTHSQASWSITLFRHYRADFDELHQQVLDARHNTDSNVSTGRNEREEKQVEAQLVQSAGTSAVDSPSGEGRVEAAQANGVAGGSDERSKHLDSDLKTIIDFFANPPDGVVKDEELWDAINDGYTCYTAASWQELYTSHQEIVNERLKAALEQQRKGAVEAAP